MFNFFNKRPSGGKEEKLLCLVTLWFLLVSLRSLLSNYFFSFFPLTIWSPRGDFPEFCLLPPTLEVVSSKNYYLTSRTLKPLSFNFPEANALTYQIINLFLVFFCPMWDFIFLRITVSVSSPIKPLNPVYFSSWPPLSPPDFLHRSELQRKIKCFLMFIYLHTSI